MEYNKQINKQNKTNTQSQKTVISKGVGEGKTGQGGVNWMVMDGNQTFGGEHTAVCTEGEPQCCIRESCVCCKPLPKF